ncbi:hypothetical protein B0H11DRAFT_1956844, partial [Mycena galericulata]
MMCLRDPLRGAWCIRGRGQTFARAWRWRVYKCVLAPWWTWKSYRSNRALFPHSTAETLGATVYGDRGGCGVDVEKFRRGCARALCPRASCIVGGTGSLVYSQRRPDVCASLAMARSERGGVPGISAFVPSFNCGGAGSDGVRGSRGGGGGVPTRPRTRSVCAHRASSAARGAWCIRGRGQMSAIVWASLAMARRSSWSIGVLFSQSTAEALGATVYGSRGGCV